MNNDPIDRAGLGQILRRPRSEVGWALHFLSFTRLAVAVSGSYP
ncbi:hypothetical protein IWX78_000211 [Mycetocola sp. CAN_C7]